MGVYAKYAINSLQTEDDESNVYKLTLPKTTVDAAEMAVLDNNGAAAAVATVTSIAPSGGTAAGGTTVTLTGTGFKWASSVLFGATAATSFVVVSDTTITCVSPAHAGGQIDITVVNPKGTSTTGAGDKFTYS